MNLKNNDYGKELILDVHGCDITRFNRQGLRRFFVELCELIDMERADLHFWDYEGIEDEKDQAPAHLAGTSAVQFIMTSNIVVHTLDKLQRIYVNIFSCKDFKADEVQSFVEDFFNGKTVNNKEVRRV